jgi:hypothetical protein
LCNGGTAARLFHQKVLPLLADAGQLSVQQLPSTSPAHAGLSHSEKCRYWLAALAPAAGTADGHFGSGRR